jgi:excisionase family DNA binding protein
MKVGTIRERLLQRVTEVLQEGSTDDVFLVSDQLRVVAGALANLAADDDVDLAGYTVDTAQAARMLSYHAEHVRRLIRQNTIQATKIGADYRIPLTELFAVLVRRHREEQREEATPDLLPSLRPEASADDAISGSVELAIDVSIVRGRDRRPVRIQRFNLEINDLLGQRPASVNGENVEQPAGD